MRFRTLGITAVALAAMGCTTWAHRSSQADREAWSVRCPCTRLPGGVGAASRYTNQALTAADRAHLEGLAHQAMASVVYVRTIVTQRQDSDDASEPVRSTSTRYGGTGIVVSATGAILTTEHVVRNARRVAVVLPDGTERVVNRIVADPRLDLAVLFVDERNLRPLALSAGGIVEGSPVVAVAGPSPRRGHGHRVGVITTTSLSLQGDLDPTGNRDYRNLIETTAPLEPGYSGGPLISADGRLLGINVAASGSAGTDRARGYTIPITSQTHLAVAWLISKAFDNGGDGK